MSIETSGWLKEVIEYSLKRPVYRMYRSRRIHSLKESINMLESLNKIPIIAEYKTKSPSGLRVVRNLEDYIKFLELYVAGFSVLTEEKYFGGSYENLIKVAYMVDKPILMKDFIMSENQIESAYNIGADAILLIASILTDRELEKLLETSRNFGLEAVVEVYTVEEAEKALRLGAEIIGVNSRNLFNLKVDLDNALGVLCEIPENVVKIAESGIKTANDIKILKKCNANAFLIGTTLMLNPNSILELIKI